MGLFDRFANASTKEETNEVLDDSSTVKRYYRALSQQIPFLPSSVKIPPTIEDFASSWSTPQLVTLATCSVISCSLGIVAGRRASTNKTFWRITNAQSVPDHFIGSQGPKLRGRVVSVSDGDTFRFYHRPTWFHSSTLDSNVKVSEQTIPVRICTIDTPEVAKFGKPSQPFGDEAKKVLERHVLNRTVVIQILQRDQYGRVVASVSKRTLFGTTRHIDEIMLKAGLAEVYRGSGAVYGPKGKDYYLRLEEKARDSKTGMWNQADRESAAEFKARTKG